VILATRRRRIGANGKAKRAGRPPKGRRGRKGAKAAKQPFIILTGL